MNEINAYTDNGTEQSAVNDLPDDVLEQMLFAELAGNEAFAAKVAPIYRDSWISDDELRPMSALVVKWRQKHSGGITRELVQAILTRYVQDHPGCGIKVGVCVQKFNRALNLNLGLSPQSRIKTINEFIRKNVLKDAIVKGAELLSSGNLKGVVDGCLALLEEAERIAPDGSDGGLRYGAYVYGDAERSKAMDSHFAAISNPGAKISTGWQSVDNCTMGGFLKDGRSLYVVMGQAGLGKTVALTNLAYNFLRQGLRVVVFTLEMSEDMYGRRLDSLISRVGLDYIAMDSTAARETEDRVRRFFEVEHPTAELTIKEFPPRSATANTLAVFMDEIRKERGGDWKPDVVIVDYLNLVKASERLKEDSMYLEGQRVSEQLRALSYKFEAPVVTAVQTNTEGMDTPDIGMKNISQSRAIAHTADFIMAIYEDCGRIRGKIVKNRLGSSVDDAGISFRRDAYTLLMEDEKNLFPKELAEALAAAETKAGDAGDVDDAEKEALGVD